MDITSYLLGKKAGGGGGSSDLDWSAIGYRGTPQTITDGYNYAKNIQQNWDSSQTSMKNKFKYDTNLVYMPLVDTSNVTDMQYMFSNCSALQTIPQLDTSKVTNMQSMFSNCSALQTIPQLNTSNVTKARGMFERCFTLQTIPQLDTSNVTTMQYMFDSCINIKNIPELDCSSVTYIAYIFNTNAGELTIENLGGFKNLGQAYLTSKSANYNDYKLDLTYVKNLTHDSLMNIINKLYDIKTKGCNNQALVLGNANLAKLSAEEIAIATNKGWNVS